MKKIRQLVSDIQWNNQLQRIAVEEGSYRQKGVTGFDMMMYPSSTAYKGQTLVFNESDRIVDQDRNEWKIGTPIAKSGEDLTFPAKLQQLQIQLNLLMEIILFGLWIRQFLYLQY